MTANKIIVNNIDENVTFNLRETHESCVEYYIYVGNEEVGLLTLNDPSKNLASTCLNIIDLIIYCAKEPLCEYSFYGEFEVLDDYITNGAWRWV